MKKNKEIELDEHGMLVFKHKTNKHLFLQRSYRWVDRITLIDEYQEDYEEGRQIIDDYKYSTYDLSAWEPMTVEEYSRVKSYFKEIYDDVYKNESTREKRIREMKEQQTTKLLNEIKELGGKVRTYPITLENRGTVRLRHHGYNGTPFSHSIPTLIIYTDETTDEIIDHLTFYRDELVIYNKALNTPSKIIDQINTIFNS